MSDPGSAGKSGNGRENVESGHYEKPTDWFDRIFKMVCVILPVLLTLIVTTHMEQVKEQETGVRLYAELNANRESSENALRKDMFNTIFESFLRGSAQELESKVLNLELLVYNFHDSLNLQPLFIHLRRELQPPAPDPAEALPPQEAETLKKNKWLLKRLEKAAKETKAQQLAIIQEPGNFHTETVNIPLDALKRQQDDITFELKLKESTSRKIVKREFTLKVNEVDLLEKEVNVRLITGAQGEDEGGSFSIDLFDFPMIDNTVLKDDTRCAVTIRSFDVFGDEVVIGLQITYFHTAHAGLKGKPHYQRIVEDLIRE